MQTSQNILYAPIRISDEVLDKEITVSDIKVILRKVKLNKAPGEDRVPYEFFVNATDEYLKELACLYNKIFNEGVLDDSFKKTIIFPIHKKGRIDEPGNYRGISFMNSVAKIFMGILDDRLREWVENKGILVEYQAGFRKNYSTSDNIYNLVSIINIKLEEGKKVYAFFVDFKAAFDKISRKSLIFKLYSLGVSYKVVKIIENMYAHTQSAIWTGDELSEYFDTKSGVKQGCLLSPLLFVLYLNDIHESIGGGLNIEEINVRVLLYADDIVLLADDIKTLDKMIRRLELYCDTWNLEVNPAKSKIMVFRKGGRLKDVEKWKYKGEEIQVVSEYNYLGVLVTPKMSFTKHIQSRNAQAKSAINVTWQDFLKKNEVSLQMKWQLFLAICRSIQAYAAQVWGYAYFEEVDKLQRFFLKKLLKLPDSTPNYALELETGIEDGHIYTLKLQLQYIHRTIFKYQTNRLPHKLSKIILRRNIFWANEMSQLANNLSTEWVDLNKSETEWKYINRSLIQKLIYTNYTRKIERASQSITRIYKHLDHSVGIQYFLNTQNQKDITWIFKARSDLIYLNGNKFNAREYDRLCTLCNLQEDETLQHFIGRCPILRSFRMECFGKTTLTEDEIIYILNGKNNGDWKDLCKFLKTSLNYRKLIITEFE